MHKTKRRQFCPEKSKIKLWVCLHNNERLNLYSFFGEEKTMDKNELMVSMRNRLLRNPKHFMGKYNRAVFIDNKTKEVITKVDQHGNFI